MTVSLGLPVCSTPHMPKEMFIYMEESGREVVANGGRESRECRKGDSKDKFEQFPVQTGHYCIHKCVHNLLFLASIYK